MKTKKILLGIGVIVFCVLAFIACNQEDSKENGDNVTKNSKIEKMDSFFEAKIADVKGKEVKVTVSKNDILQFAKEALEENQLNLKPFDYKIIEENGIRYLRILSDRKYVSTIELIESNNTLRTGKTVCTSTACASGGGCIPNGSYCTPCQPASYPPTISGDCSRTTTGGIE
jgi:hypothetical protein